MADQSIASAGSAGKSTVPLLQGDKLSRCIGAITTATNELNQFHGDADGMEHIIGGLMLAREGLLEMEAGVGDTPARCDVVPALCDSGNARAVGIRLCVKQLEGLRNVLYSQVAISGVARDAVNPDNNYNLHAVLEDLHKKLDHAVSSVDSVLEGLQPEVSHG